jgi:MoaA/NifB/PqqE/SkfB family radical SAM enzyme
MDYDKFADMLKRMGSVMRFFINNISITGRGDPTSHPDLLKFCRIANHYKKPFSITSNGDKMNPEFFHELSKLKHLRFVRVSLFNVEKAKYWLDLQEKNNVRIDFMNETGVKLDGYDDGYISTNNPGTAKYSTMPLNFVTETYCRSPFSFNTLNTDGSVVTCITFFELGNAFEEPFWKIWNGKRMRLIRKQALKMAIPEHLADCRNCGVFMKLPKYQKLNTYKKHKIEDK